MEKNYKVLSGNKDVFGNAFLDFLSGNTSAEILVSCNVLDAESIPVSYFFRGEFEMPIIELKALNLCKGHILDVGAGCGVHSLLLQQRNMEVTALENSAGAIKTMKDLGVNKVIFSDYYKHREGSYDTLLLLMNNAGIAGTLDNLSLFLEHAMSLLNIDGQLLLSSADIAYAFIDENGHFSMDWDQKYYGEVQFTVEYKNHISDPFPWLFVDYYRLFQECSKLGLNCEKLMDGEHHDYLAKITRL